MIFFPLYITAWASSLLLNVNNNNNNNNPLDGCVCVGLATAPTANPIANTHSASQPYIIDPPNVIGRGKNELWYSLGNFCVYFLG